jgi:protein-S-isoprenylcysteine O-methyltransferase Ste14
MPELSYVYSTLPTGRYVRLFLAIKTLLFTVFVPGTVMVYIPYRLHAGSEHTLEPSHWALTLFAVFCILAGIGIYLRCAWDFISEGLGTPAPLDPPKRLVVGGLYRRNRNPMYQGVVMTMLAESLLFLDSSLLIYAGAIALLFHTSVYFYEEPMLMQRFGEDYRHYCNLVPRWGLALRANWTDSNSS